MKTVHHIRDLCGVLYTQRKLPKAFDAVNQSYQRQTQLVLAASFELRQGVVEM